MILHFNNFWFSLCFFAGKSFCFVYFFAGFNFWTRRTKRKLELIFWKMEASIKI
jgi:hypothetical protein